MWVWPFKRYLVAKTTKIILIWDAFLCSDDVAKKIVWVVLVTSVSLSFSPEWDLLRQQAPLILALVTLAPMLLPFAVTAILMIGRSHTARR